MASVASSGTLESHSVLERVAMSLVEFHSPMKSRPRKQSQVMNGGLLGDF